MTQSSSRDDREGERLNAMIKALNGGVSTEPTPDETDVHYERLKSYVSNVTVTALNEIGSLREECGQLIHTVHEQQEILLQHLHAYSLMAKSLLESKKIMGDALAGINEQFKSLANATTLPHAPMPGSKGTH